MTREVTIMKRILVVFLAFCLLFSFAACGKDRADTPSADTPQDETTGTATKPSGTEGSAPTTQPEATSATEETVGETTATTAPTVPDSTTVPTEPTEKPSPSPTTPTNPTPTPEPTNPTPTPEPTNPVTPHTHSYSSRVTVAASCTANGVKTYTCACGSSYTEAISAVGHSWGQWATTQAPSTTAEGISQRKCNNCSATESKSIAKLPDPTPQDGTVTQAQLDQIYEIFLRLVNEERTRVGVGTLTPNAYLDSCAQIRSNETLESFSHTRPDGQPWVTVLDTNSYPYVIAGENLCMTSHIGSGSYTAADKWVGSQAQIEAAAGWIFILFKESPGHYKNMLDGRFTECGIGISSIPYADTEIPMFYLAHIFGDR